MAQFYARRTFLQNPLFGSKNELAGATPTKGNNTPGVSRVHTPALFLAFNPIEQVFKYVDDHLQRAIKLALEFFRQGQQHQSLSKPRERPFSLVPKLL